jgi:hypothetical protein
MLIIWATWRLTRRAGKIHGTGLFKSAIITFDTDALNKRGDSGKGETVAHEGAHGVDQLAGWGTVE